MILGSLREGAAARTRLGESAQRKVSQSRKPHTRGLLPSRLRVPPPSRREAYPLRHAARATPPGVRGILWREQAPALQSRMISLRRETKLHFASAKLHFVARRNFTFRAAENFTAVRKSPAMRRSAAQYSTRRLRDWSRGDGRRGAVKSGRDRRHRVFPPSPR